jgi:hypothetical protein
MTTKPTLRTLDDGSLQSALAEARRRLSDLDTQIEALRAGRRPLAREVELLEQLLALRSPDADAASSDGGFADEPVNFTFRHRGPHPAVVEAIRELDAAGRPLHISELMRLLKASDITIPGAGAQANLIAHMTRSPEIVRPSRGMYALASWGSPEQQPLKPATKRRRRGPSGISDQTAKTEAGER